MAKIPENFKDGDLLPEGMGGEAGQKKLIKAGSSGTKGTATTAASAVRTAIKKINSRECVRPECGERERILSDGTCEKCAENTIVTPDKKQCIIPDCKENEFI